MSASDYPGARTYGEVRVEPISRLYDADRPAPPRILGGPIWPNWDDAEAIRQKMHGRLNDARPQRSAQAVRVEGGRHFWIGPVIPHFGHFVGEVAARILPSLLAVPDATLVFGVRTGTVMAGVETLPAFVRAILDWYDVPPARVRLVAEPTDFETLHVVPFPERIGFDSACAPHPAHVDALGAHVAARLGSARREGVLFVSRAGMPVRLLGEAQLEQAFAAAGAHVLRPETLSLPDQLRAYRSAGLLVITEGSALHGLELLGRDLGPIVVLQRRPSIRASAPNLSARSERVSYVNAVCGMISGLRPDGVPHDASGVPALDVEALLKALSEFGLDLGRAWDQAAFVQAERRDLAEWLHRVGPRLIHWNRGSHNLILERIAAAGLRADPLERLLLGARQIRRWHLPRARSDARG